MSSPAREVYDHLAPQYDERWSHYTEATLRETLEHLNPAPGCRLLDLAAGTGSLATRLLPGRPDLKYVGLDLSKGMLDRGRARGAFGAVPLIQATAERLPFASEQFDQIVCSSGFHHFPKPMESLAEACRVLRPGGRFVLVDWCDDYLSCKLCALYLRWTDPSFVKSYTQAECQRMLQTSGFEVIEQSRFKIDWLWGLMRLEAIRPIDGLLMTSRRQSA